MESLCDKQVLAYTWPRLASTWPLLASTWPMMIVAFVGLSDLGVLQHCQRALLPLYSSKGHCCLHTLSGLSDNFFLQYLCIWLFVECVAQSCIEQLFCHIGVETSEN